MTSWILVILFYGSTGPFIAEGWYPIEMRTETGCEVAAGKVRHTLEGYTPHDVFCVPYVVEGGKFGTSDLQKVQ